MSGALYWGGSRANTCRKQTSTQWSHLLSLARRSASTCARNAAYICGPFLTRSDTVSTRRRARRRKADNSTGLVGTGSGIELSKTVRAMDTGERVDSLARPACCWPHDARHAARHGSSPSFRAPSPFLLCGHWCCPLCARLGTTRGMVGVLCGGVRGGGVPDGGSGPPPREFPLEGANACTTRRGVTLLYGPSICTRFIQMDLRRIQVRRPLPTPGSGTLWFAGESLRDRRVSCLPRWTVCPTRSPSQDTNFKYMPWEVLLVRPIGHPPRPVPPRAASQRSEAYPTSLRVLRWRRYGHQGGPRTPGVRSLASVPFRLFSPRPPPSAVLALAPQLFTLGFPPSRAPFYSPRFLPCPACPLLSFPALALCLSVSGPGSGRLAPPLPAAPLSLRPCGHPCVPPNVPIPSPRRHRPLPGGVGVRGGSVLRSMHAASTMQERGAALVCGEGLFPSWPPRSLRLLSFSLCWGGGVSRVAPFGALRALSPRLWHVPSVGGKLCASTLRGTALLYLVLCLLPPHQAALSVGGTRSVPSPSSSPS